MTGVSSVSASRRFIAAARRGAALSGPAGIAAYAGRARHARCGRYTRSAGRRHAQARRRRRADPGDRTARTPVAGADAADVPPWPAAACFEQDRDSDRRGWRHRGAGAETEAGAGFHREFEGYLCGGSAVGGNHPRKPRETNMRVGQGFDVHALVTGRKLIIGGVDIPNEKGLDGHSDADVLLHALCDALLGAGALGDIGRHFPDTDARYKNADSRMLLREVSRLVQEAGYRIVNIDATIIAQAPKMAPHIPSMVNNIAADLGLSRGQVNIKATSTE